MKTVLIIFSLIPTIAFSADIDQKFGGAKMPFFYVDAAGNHISLEAIEKNSESNKEKYRGAKMPFLYTDPMTGKQFSLEQIKKRSANSSALQSFKKQFCGDQNAVHNECKNSIHFHDLKKAINNKISQCNSVREVPAANVICSEVYSLKTALEGFQRGMQFSIKTCADRLLDKDNGSLDAKTNP